MRIQVRDFMTSPVITAVGTDNVKMVRALMDKKSIHAIPIVEYSKKLPELKRTIQGIITATDLNKKIGSKTSVDEIMTTSVHIVHPDSSAKAAAKMMLKHRVHHLVVMEEGKITGMLSALDFVNLVSEHSLD